MRKQLETLDLRKSSHVALFSFLSLRLGYQFISSLVATRGQAVNALSEGRWCGHCALPDVSRIAISVTKSLDQPWFPGATLPSSRSVKLCLCSREAHRLELSSAMDGHILSHRLLRFVATFSGLFARNNSRGSIQDDTRGGEEKSLIDRCSLATIFS